MGLRVVREGLRVVTVVRFGVRGVRVGDRVGLRVGLRVVTVVRIVRLVRVGVRSRDNMKGRALAYYYNQ